MKVIGYLRVSSKGQIDGDGFDRQQLAVEKFCDAHKLDCIEVFEECGVSGDVEGLDRPAFAELVHFVEQSRTEGDTIEGIVVERMDRLARDLMVSEVLTQECRKKGLKIFAADQGVLIDMSDDSTDPTRTLIRQLMAALSQWEKNMLVRKMAAARARIFAEKGRCGGKIPFGGYPEDRVVIQFLNNTRTTMRICDQRRMLNEHGLLTREGTPWDNQNVWKALKTMRTRGLMTEESAVEAEQIASVFQVNV